MADTKAATKPKKSGTESVLDIFNRIAKVGESTISSIIGPSSGSGGSGVVSPARTSRMPNVVGPPPRSGTPNPMTNPIPQNLPQGSPIPPSGQLMTGTNFGTAGARRGAIAGSFLQGIGQFLSREAQKKTDDARTRAKMNMSIVMDALAKGDEETARTILMDPKVQKDFEKGLGGFQWPLDPNKPPPPESMGMRDAMNQFDQKQGGGQRPGQGGPQQSGQISGTVQQRGPLMPKASQESQLRSMIMGEALRRLKSGDITFEQGARVLGLDAFSQTPEQFGHMMKIISGMGISSETAMKMDADNRRMFANIGLQVESMKANMKIARAQLDQRATLTREQFAVRISEAGLDRSLQRKLAGDRDKTIKEINSFKNATALALAKFDAGIKKAGILVDIGELNKDALVSYNRLISDLSNIIIKAEDVGWLGADDELTQSIKANLADAVSTRDKFKQVVEGVGVGGEEPAAVQGSGSDAEINDLMKP